MKFIVKLLTQPAYLEFTHLDTGARYFRHDTWQLQQRDGNTVSFQQIKCRLEPVAAGPHYKQQRFWLWAKPKHWTWGSKVMGRRVADISTDDPQWNECARVSQRWSVDSSTLPAAWWDGKHLCIDLDAWTAYLAKPFPVPSFIHTWGHLPAREVPAREVPERINHLLEEILTGKTTA
jgi:hypothetical protein